MSGGSAGSRSAGTRPRYAVASSHCRGFRPGSLRVSSCSDARARGHPPSRRGGGGSSPRASPRLEVAARSAQLPSKGSRARCHISAWSASSRTWKTTASVTWRGAARVDSGTRFETTKQKPPGLAAGGVDRSRLRRRRRPTRVRRPRRGVRVALVTDVGQLNDRGFNQLAYQGLKRAEKELGIKIRVVESASAADYVPNYTALVRQGYDLVIGVGFAQGDAIDTAATQNPNRSSRSSTSTRRV